MQRALQQMALMKQLSVSAYSFAKHTRAWGRTGPWNGWKKRMRKTPARWFTSAGQHGPAPLDARLICCSAWALSNGRASSETEFQRELNNARIAAGQTIRPSARAEDLAGIRINASA